MPKSTRLSDGSTATTGDRVFNYYDRYPVTLGPVDSDGWFDTIRDDGTRGPMLNGERLCSLETAADKGWHTT